MNGYYTEKIKVVGDDFMCFPVRQSDLEAVACSTYDPYAWSDPDPEPIETISFSEWTRRCNERWDKMTRPYSGGNHVH